ncbi:MAG: hypothetical protein QOI19_106 [Thermoleophilaceae bacterium]|jgi:hypothetical protein|nr:hypothetical protein [Thermoleophilaceae bacterium]
MNSRRVVLCLGALASALLASAAPASAAKTAEPVIKSFSPMKLKVGEKLTIKGKYFLAGKAKTRIFFVRGRGGAAFAPSDGGTTTKLTVTLPAQLDKVLKGKASRIQIRVLAKRFGKLTAASKSPLVSPAGAGGTGGGSGQKTCMPGDKALATNDSDKDGLNDALEVSVATDPCAADTDKDGVPDGFEYYSAQDLNSTVLFGTGPLLPYPGKRPYPNALNQDQDVDYDGDGLTLSDEYALWHKYGDGQFPLTSYSDGRQMTKTVAADSSMPWQDMNWDGYLNDGEQDADGDHLSNWDERHGRITPEWWASKYDGNNGAPKETPYPLVVYPSTDMLDPDSNGDGVIDGLSDQDHDGLTNQFEIDRPLDWEDTYVSTAHNWDSQTNAMDPTADPYARVNPFNPCKPVYSQTCHVHPPFGTYKNEDWAFPPSLMSTLPPPGATP